MGYRIQYVQSKKNRSVKTRSIRKVTILCGWILGLVIGCVWPEVSDTIKNILFPGDLAVTAAALENLTVDLRSGIQVRECLQNFCRYILEGAGIGTVR